MEKLNAIRFGDASPLTDLLQTALLRAGFETEIDGIFGSDTRSAAVRFQATRGLAQDGVVGERTWSALMPYLTGYITHTLRRGDTLYKLALANKTTVAAIETANPGIAPDNLKIGEKLIIPLWFDIVATNIRVSPQSNDVFLRGIAVRYPFVDVRPVGESVMRRGIYAATLGTGTHHVFYNAAHHANEWITASLLLKFLEAYAKAKALGGHIYGIDAQSLFSRSVLHMVPLVNPDGVSLVTGALRGGQYYTEAEKIAARYPSVPFPAGWKANIEGIDTNLQYPANWNRAKEIKFAQGWTSPAPRDFVGTAPLAAPESIAARNYTLSQNFALTLSYHTQGNVIYWKYLDMLPPKSREIAWLFSRVSGYPALETPPESAFAGYKDWFIETYNRPGYTIEVGSGVSPVPIEQFDEIYSRNLGILTLGLTANI